VLVDARRLLLSLGLSLVAGAAACAAPASTASSLATARPGDPSPPWQEDFPKPISIYAATEDSTKNDSVEDVTYRDATSAQHRLQLRFTSYPITPTSLVVDGRAIPRGPAWGRLGRALHDAGLDNNATVLLRCFGNDPSERC
jgi:hypothetical protein